MTAKRKVTSRRRSLSGKMRAPRAYGRSGKYTRSIPRVSPASRMRRKRASVSTRHSSSEGVAHMRDLPRIAFRGAAGNKRAYVEGTPFDVWEIVEAYEVMRLRITKEGDLTRDELAVALNYYSQHRHEVDRRIEANRRSKEVWSQLYPDVFATQ